jgi:hypothetical protein
VRTRVVVAFVLALSVPVAPAAARPDAPNQEDPDSAPGGAGAVIDETGIASWMFPTGRPGRSTWFFGGAYRTAVAGGRTVTVGFAVRGTCTTTHRDGVRITECGGTGTGGRIPAGAFRVDPAMREGKLVLRERTRTHRIAWRADEAPLAGYFQTEACQQGTGRGAGFVQHATAAGRIFGRRLSSHGVDHAILTRGAMVTECTGASIEDLARRAAAGKPVRVVFR